MNKMKDTISPTPVFTKTKWNVKFHLARKGLMGNNTWKLLYYVKFYTNIYMIHHSQHKTVPLNNFMIHVSPVSSLFP